METPIRPLAVVLSGALAVLASGTAVADGPGRATALPDPSMLTVTSAPFDGTPYAAVTSADGRYLYVSVSGRDGRRASVQVLSRVPQGFGNVRFTIPLRSSRALGFALLPSGAALVVAEGDGLEVAGGRIGAWNRPQYVAAGGGAGVTNVIASPDSRFVYVSEAGRHAVGVFAMHRQGSGAVVASRTGEIPVAGSPGDLVLSPGGDVIYVASSALAIGARGAGGSTTAATCARGTLTAVDTRSAQTDPRHAAAHSMPTGCDPAQLALTADGSTLWVALRGDRAVVAYDTRRIGSDPAHAEIARIAAPPAPAAIALARGDGALVVANTNRFDPSVAGSSATFFDVRGEPAVINGFRTGDGPVRFSRSPDGKSLYLTNARSRTVMIVDAVHAVQPGE